MEVLDHKCPACTAKLPFNPTTQKWDCEYCGSSYKLEELEEFEKKQKEQEDKSKKNMLMWILTSVQTVVQKLLQIKIQLLLFVCIAEVLV